MTLVTHTRRRNNMKRTAVTIMIFFAGMGCTTSNQNSSLTLTKDERLRYFDAQFEYQKKINDLNTKDAQLTGDLQKQLVAKNVELNALVTPQLRQKQTELADISAKIKVLVDPLQQQANIAASDRDQVLVDIAAAHHCKGCQLDDGATARTLITPEQMKARADEAAKQQQKVTH